VTSKDKTGDQLMASIRKTKTEGAAPETKAAATPKTAAPAAKKKAVPAPQPAAAKPRTTHQKTSAKAGAAPADSGSSDASYQSSKRVWPD